MGTVIQISDRQYEACIDSLASWGLCRSCCSLKIELGASYIANGRKDDGQPGCTCLLHSSTIRRLHPYLSHRGFAQLAQEESQCKESGIHRQRSCSDAAS